VADLSILQRRARLVGIMHNGNFHELDRNAFTCHQARSAVGPLHWLG
jgi:hypothetical protein